MGKNRWVIIIALLLAGVTTASAVTFATKRLESVARCLVLPQLDTLQPGATSHQYRLNGRQLTVRMNAWGEVAHIGLYLFDRDLFSDASTPLYDFLERNLLERNLPQLDGELLHRQKSEHVYFVKGSARTPFTFTGQESYSEERIDLKRYRVSWTRDDVEVLKISFDMDIELLLGCNAIELEQLFMKNVQRYTQEASVSDIDIFPREAKAYVAKGDSFLIKEMRNDLYFEHDSAGWHLTDNAESVSKTLNNMMLSPQFRGQPTLELTLDKYGYETEKATVSYGNLLRMCINDGCTPYFGIKERQADGTYTGTVMLVNRRAGYVHMLSVRVPAETLLSAGHGMLYGRLYVYIPMHNVSDRFFEQNKTIKK